MRHMGDGGEVSLQEDHDVGVLSQEDAILRLMMHKNSMIGNLTSNHHYIGNHLAFTLDEMREYLIVIVVLCKILSIGDGCKVVDKVLSHIARPDCCQRKGWQRR